MRKTDVQPCPFELRKEALKTLYAGLSPDQQQTLLLTLEQQRARREEQLIGLLVGLEERKITAACWIQPLPGSTALLWPPNWNSSLASPLLEEANRLLEAWDTNLAQMIIARGQRVEERLLEVAGFAKLAELAYLSLDLAESNDCSSTSRLDFRTLGQFKEDSLLKVVKQTYAGTRDVPELNSQRLPEATLASYRSQGEFIPENWLLALEDGVPVGVLILTPYDDGRITELTYMGIIPAARGKRYGKELLTKAIARCKQRGSERLVLAVDERNEPAQRHYYAAGFRAWDRRIVYARLGKV